MRARHVVFSVGVGFSLACGGMGESLREKAERELVEKAIENGAGKDVDLEVGDGGDLTVKGPDGLDVTVGDSAKIPADWPAEFPVYTGTALQLGACQGAAGAAGSGCLVSGESTDSVDTIADWYKSRMSGWTQQADMNTGDSRMVSWTRADGKETAVVSLSKGEKTQVALSYQHQ